MDKIFKCEDIGFDCTFAACGQTEEEVFKKVEAHAQTAHNLAYNSMIENVRGVTYDGYCDYGDTEETITEECSECYNACYECVDECC